MPNRTFDAASPMELVVSNAPADPTEAGAIRRAVGDWLAVTAFDESARADITLAVYEAMANVVEHAYQHKGQPGTMTVHAAYAPAERALEVAVVDYGRWRTPDADDRRGYGIPLMNNLSNDTSIGHTASGTSVLMRWTM